MRTGWLRRGDIDKHQEARWSAAAAIAKVVWVFIGLTSLGRWVYDLLG